MTLGCALAMLLLLDPVRPASGPRAAPSDRQSAGRASALAMFARAYYPGRSGQIAVVPKEGEFITRRGIDFMHGSPWDYDVRIPFLLWGPGRIRKGVFAAPVAQQDLAPTLARMLDVVLPGATGRPLDEALVPGTRPPRAMLVLVLVMVIDGFILGRKANRLVDEKFPDNTESGWKLGFYAASRASQLRRMRAPRPQVERGHKVT